jgi:ribose 1,5-bisphosphokinase
VPCEIERWLAEGATVVVNGSREHLDEARRRFPALEAVHVSAPALVLARRLAMRGRETRLQAARRLARNAAVCARAADANLTIVNTGTIDEAGGALLRFLCPGGRGAV